jgi:hypothetical protein
MRLGAPSLIVWISCSVGALATAEKQKGVGAAAVASGAAEAAKLDAKAADVQKKLEKEVGEMVLQSNEKVKSLKGMLTTNSKAIAALTGLFKEVSRLTTAIGMYETKLHACKKELATVQMQQEAGPSNDAYFDSASNDPLAGMSFFQEKAETALAHATGVFSKMQKNPQGISLLQQHHRHHRRSESEEEDTEDSAAADNTESVTDTSYTSDAIAFGLNTIGAGEEDMDSRTRNVDRTRVALPGTDPLEYGMYDFTGSHGVKIFDHDSLDPDVQRKRELASVNLMTRQSQYDDDDDD